MKCGTTGLTLWGIALGGIVLCMILWAFGNAGPLILIAAATICLLLGVGRRPMKE